MNRLARAGMAFVLLALTVLQASTASTRLRWRWSNPLPFGANIADLVVHAGEPVVAVAEYGQLFSSSDGTAWKRHELGTDRWLRSGAYFGSTTNGYARLLVVGGEEGNLFVSEDLSNFLHIDLGTTDWIEGVAASPTRLVAVGDNAAVYTSDDGTNWIRRTTPFDGTWLRGVTWRTNGIFAVVGEGGLIGTSPDGVAWTTQSRRTSQHLNRIIPFSTGFVAVGEGGTVLQDTSGRGSNWKVLESGATGDLYAAAQEYRAELPGQPVGALLVAGDAEVRSGILAINTWVDETDPRRPSPAPRATYLTGYWNTTNALFAGRAGLVLTGVRPTVSSSFQWSIPDSPPRSWLFAAGTDFYLGTNRTAALVNDQVVESSHPYTNQFAIAVGDGPTILQSNRGISWDLSLLPANAAGIVYLGLATRPGLLVAVGSSGVISYSADAYEPQVTTNTFTNSSGGTVSVVLTNHLNTIGLAWEAAESPVTNTLQGVSAGADRLIAAGAAGVLLTSGNGRQWTRLESPVTAYLSGVASSPARWVATGESGTLLTSPDGTTWTPRATGLTNWIWQVRWLDDRFVAVGHGGLILTSPDGVTWTRRESGVSNNLNDATRVGDTFYVVGNQGTVLGSVDGISWNRLDTITSKSLFGVAYLGGRLLAVGADGSIIRAVVTPLSSPIVIREWPRSPDESLFSLFGEQDQYIRLDRGTNLVDWAASEWLEIEDPDGSLIFLDNATYEPDRQFFRGRSIAP